MKSCCFGCSEEEEEEEEEELGSGWTWQCALCTAGLSGVEIIFKLPLISTKMICEE